MEVTLKWKFEGDVPRRAPKSSDHIRKTASKVQNVVSDFRFRVFLPRATSTLDFARPGAIYTERETGRERNGETARKIGGGREREKESERERA